MKNIIIRQATSKDLEDILLFELSNRKWFSQFFPEKMLSMQTRSYFKCMLNTPSKGLHYLVFLPGGMLIGRFSAQKIGPNSQALEVSYRISKGFNNLGIARYVLKRLLLVWSSYGVKELYAQVADHNNASIKVLISCGFQILEVSNNTINLTPPTSDCFVFRWSVTET